MPSYYRKVNGSLVSGQIADPTDIMQIQNNTQDAFQQITQDIFGEGCILDEDEDALKLTPIPIHIDQENKNYDETDNFTSFYDIYLKQQIDIKKSEIKSIKLQMRNDSVLSPTIFAEIRDHDMVLQKESNTVLPSTIGDDPVEIEFIFNLEHLPIGEYYFILRPVDITSIDLTINGDETVYDTITPDMFQVKYDRGGNYNEGLSFSYNGVDYLESRLLDDGITIQDNNFDLYFEHIFSDGNTYVINPAKCLVLGEPVTPIDTHVTIDGPSKTGDRIDLVTLTTDGQLHVESGIPYTGEKEEKHYPINTSGFKIAYITTYQNSQSLWTCSTCGTVNDGHTQGCYNCGTANNNKIPLIEQSDENGITRQRDILERLRRLENKMVYHEENDLPSRIKYTCTVDPTMAALNVDGTEFNEDSYGIAIKNTSTGNIGSFNDNKTYTKAWSIVDKITTTKTTKTKQYGFLEAQNVAIPATKPKKPTTSQFFNVHAYIIKTNKTTTVKENKDKTTTQSVNETKVGISIPLTIEIKNKKGKKIKTISKKTSSKGKIKLDLWQYKLSKGEYTIVTKYEDKKVSTNLTICSGNCTATSKTKKVNITISTTSTPSSNTNIDNGTIAGNDSFYTENMTVDTENGEVFIAKQSPTKPKKKLWSTITEKQKKSLKTSNKDFEITNSSSGQYGMLSFEIDKDCTIYDITPYITKFTNISAFRIVLFENNKIFSLNRSRTSYIKELITDKAKNTNFPNKFSSEWVTVTGTSKKGVVEIKKPHTFNLGEKGRKLTKGVYSLIIIGKLKNKSKEGKISIKQYSINNAAKNGAVSVAKGSNAPKQVLFDNYSLTNRTWYVTMNMYTHTYNNTGTLVSKTIDTTNNIRSCIVTANYETPDGCDIDTYVSNNGGRSYVLMGNNKNEVTFKGLGHEFRWRIVFHGSSTDTPKLKYSSKSNMRCAIKFELTESENIVNYEDFDRCFATPLFNANAITRTLAQNKNIKNSFEEWEFCRLWMEDEQDDASIDICFAYDYDNYSTDVTTKQSLWPSTIFFSQVLSNLKIKDFSQQSIDYSNYNADVEYDENNFRFKFDENLYNENKVTVTTPLANANNYQYNYSYGDITDEYTDMSNFDYGLMDIPYVYSDNYDLDNDDTNDDENRIYAGTYIVAGPYYQAQYNPKVATNDITIDIDEDTEDTEEATNIEMPSTVWAADGLLGDYNENACIIGVTFANGLKIDDKYTALEFDIFPNLRDCKEEDEKTGELELDSEGKAILDIDTYDETKYVDKSGHYYIPKNTLEIVVSLNPYGIIEDDNATYGKAYPITVPLRSCTFTSVAINLADLYGSTIYSFGIRVNTAKDSQGNPIVKEKDGKHPSLHSGDILGLGNITFEMYNIKPYTPYIYTGYTKRWNWKAINKSQKSYASILYSLIRESDQKTRYAKLMIPRKKDPADSYIQSETNKENESDPSVFEWYTRQNISTLINMSLDKASYQQIKTKDSNRIQVKSGDELIGTSTNNANVITFMINSNDGVGNLFKVDTDIDLTPYNWVNIQYHIELIKDSVINDSNNSNYYETGQEIKKGDIFFDFYDTTDIVGATPIESFALPAWGKVQDRYGNGRTEQVNKTVNAWFKIHSNASSVKCIVLRRANPTKATMNNINLVLRDIVFLNTETVPALGPQMHVRIYPESMNTTRNTKIRKVGCVYRIG